MAFRDKVEAGRRSVAKPNKTTDTTPPEEIPPIAWNAPLPMGGGSSLAVPAFPLSVFPDPIAEACEALAKAMQCPIDYPACSMLAVAAGCIGATHEVELKKGWRHKARLTLCLVGTSNSKKSPPMRKIFDPLEREQEFRAERGLLCRFTDPDGRNPKLRIYQPNEGEIYVTDATGESANELLYCQRRGLIFYSDEILSWLNSQNQYRGGKGAERQNWLTLADGGTVTVSRKGLKHPLVLRNPTMTLMGGIQPAVLPDLFTREDGLPERFAWCFPDPIPEQPEDWLEWSDDHYKLWAGVCRRLLGLQMQRGEWATPTDDNPSPLPPIASKTTTLKLSKSAREVWEEMRKDLAKMMNDTAFNTRLAGIYGKSKDLCARLSLILEFLDWAGSPTREHEESPKVVDGVSMAKAVMVTDYFRGHAQRVYDAVATDARIEPAKKIWKWIVKGQRWDGFSRSEIWSSLHSSFRSIEALTPPLQLLCKLNWLRVVEQEYAGRGAPPTPKYEVNPAKIEEEKAK
jgi:hypothetical protein